MTTPLTDAAEAQHKLNGHPYLDDLTKAYDHARELEKKFIMARSMANKEKDEADSAQGRVKELEAGIRQKMIQCVKLEARAINAEKEVEMLREAFDRAVVQIKALTAERDEWKQLATEMAAYCETKPLYDRYLKLSEPTETATGTPVTVSPSLIGKQEPNPFVVPTGVRRTWYEMDVSPDLTEGTSGPAPEGFKAGAVLTQVPMSDSIRQAISDGLKYGTAAATMRGPVCEWAKVAGFKSLIPGCAPHYTVSGLIPELCQLCGRPIRVTEGQP